MPRVVIVGAGITGLTVAHRLHGIDVTVLEQAGRVGGVVWTEHADGFTAEAGPNGFRDNVPAVLDLARDLGLGDRLVPASDAAARNRYLFLGDKLCRLPSGPPGLLTTPILSLRGKLELLAEPFRARRRSRGDESVAAFARRRFGKEAADTFVDALVTGIYAGDPERLSVRSCFPRLVEMEEECGSVLRGFLRLARHKRREAKTRGETPQPVRMWSFRGGLRVLIEGLRDRLPRPPLTGVSVRQVERTADGWLVRGDGADGWPADAVVLACPAHAQAELLADLDPELSSLIGGIASNRIAVVAVGFRTADVPVVPEGFGYLAPQNTRRDLLGVQWCSAIYPDRAPPGTVLWRALCGGWNRPDAVDWDDDRLLAAVRAELRLAQGVTAAPVFHRVVRWRPAIPQYFVGHGERVAAIEARAARFPGLFLAGNAYHGVSLNDCVEQAGRVARPVGGPLAPRP